MEKSTPEFTLLCVASLVSLKRVTLQYVNQASEKGYILMYHKEGMLGLMSTAMLTSILNHRTRFTLQNCNMRQ